MAYIDGKEIMFSANVNIENTSSEGSAGVKEWVETETYRKGEIVSYNGLIYTPKVDSTLSVLPTDTEVWEDLTNGNREYVDEVNSVVENKLTYHDRRITNLERRLPESTIVTDDNIAYFKDLPANACPWVQIHYVGGMSYAENNVLKHTDIDRIWFSINAYGEPNDITIPEAIRSIEGWGWGVNSKYYSRLDFVKKEFERMTHRLVLTGGETWYTTGTNTGTKRWQCPLAIKGVSVASAEVGNIICTHYEPTTNNKTYGRRNGISTQGANFIIFDEAYENATAAEWKAYLKQLYDSGTPIVVEYAMLTPVITDISQYFDDIIVSGISYPQPIKFDGFIYFPIEEGVGGGQFEFMNTNTVFTETPVPSSITYMLREV